MNAILKTPLMHKKEKKKKPPHFVTGVTEMDDGYVRTRHVQKKKKKNPGNIAASCGAVINVKINI